MCLYKLEHLLISNSIDINTYQLILDEFSSKTPFYSLEYLDHNKSGNLSYFVFKKHNKPLALLPIYLNPSPNKFNDIQYYDAISPYGYSGPLYQDVISENEITLFWNYVDQWYLKNNVITEFIRFSLNNNYLNYSGLLIPSLKNITGELTSYNEIWSNFKQKVRNNYRKALSSKLSIKIYYKEISLKHIREFYNIYINTMIRKEATDSFFHDIDYFVNLINNNKSNVILAIVYKQSLPVSTELILTVNKKLYSYLGGTMETFFDCRPNDYLKNEIIKWAIDNNFDFYCLGGGRKDLDGLYHYKKSFFPKDKEEIYYTGRKVINRKIYNLLLSEHNLNYEELEHLITIPKIYFPFYKPQT
ncbi:GNAT family N-acetyltransferase [Formosa sp. S-31]|uniref:GNAT family N-acetyltransferase n=1 Tax=Formosa sp. S-31 TaxID=2790949 RepID=UPI003EB8E5E3